MNKRNRFLFIAEEHPLEYTTKVSDELNGTTGASVDFIDIGCGFGGLLCKNAFFTRFRLSEFVY